MLWYFLSSICLVISKEFPSLRWVLRFARITYFYYLPYDVTSSLYIALNSWETTSHIVVKAFLAREGLRESGRECEGAGERGWNKRRNKARIFRVKPNCLHSCPVHEVSTSYNLTIGLREHTIALSRGFLVSPRLEFVYLLSDFKYLLHSQELCILIFNFTK